MSAEVTQLETPGRTMMERNRAWIRRYKAFCALMAVIRDLADYEPARAAYMTRRMHALGALSDIECDEIFNALRISAPRERDGLGWDQPHYGDDPNAA